MATITRENTGLLQDKLIVKIAKEDYLPAFQKALKEYSKKANIPGFRKGMVPSGLIKKMYGTSIFTDEILRTADQELFKYMETEKLEIFAQPLPVETDLKNLDMNNPSDYNFHFEIGLKPEIKNIGLDKGKYTKYKVAVTEEMIENEVERLQNRHGSMSEPETVTGEENVLNVNFVECDADGNEKEDGIKKDNSLLVKYFTKDIQKDLTGKKKDESFVIQLKNAFDAKEREWILGDLGLDKEDTASIEKYFKLFITKLGLLEKKELNEEFFNQLYPGDEIKTEADFRNKLKEEIEKHWDSQARNQIHDQIYHQMVDHTEIAFPEAFLKKWLQTQGANENGGGIKTEEEVEKEFPVFTKQLKWTLLSEKIVADNAIQVQPDEIRNFARQQLFGYMGMPAQDEEQPWVSDYVEKMMKDRKYLEDAYNRLQTQKVFEWAETQVKPLEQIIGAEEFTKMVEEHKH